MSRRIGSQSSVALHRACAEVLEGRTLLSGAPAVFQDLAALSGQQSVNGNVSASHASDFYRFTSRVPGTVDLKLTSLTKNANLLLLDAGGNTIASSHAGGTADEQITATVVPQTFYAQVVFADGSGSTPYSLRLTADDAGDTPAKARQVGAFNGRVEFDDFLGTAPSDNDDYYAFQFNRAGNFTAVASSPNADLTLSLARDANGNGVIDAGETIVTSATPGVGVNESILNLPLGVGSYLVHLNRVAGNSNYHLRLGADMAGNTRANARDIGTLAGQQSFTDLVSSGDHDDFYKFTLPTAGTVRVDLSGLTNDVNVKLVNSQGVAVVSQNNGPSNNQPIIQALSAGTFFVHIGFISGDTVYTLRLTSNFAGSSIATARDLGDLSAATTATIDDFVDDNDPVDFYKFSLSTTRKVDVLMNNMTQNADLETFIDLINPGTIDTGETLISSHNPGTNFDEVSPTYAPGTYFLRVVSRASPGQATNYRLNINTTPASAPDDRGGDSAGNAKAIGTLGSATQTFVDFVGGVDSADVYQFTLARLSTIHLQLDGLSANADLILFTAPAPNFFPETVVSTSINSGNLSEDIFQTVAPGTYFARVRETSGDTYYRLQMTVAEEDGAGESAAAARDLGTLSNISFSDRIGGPDPADFYKFSVSAFKHVNITVNGLTTADADVQLLDNGQNIIATSAHAGATPESIVQNLVPGTYFVHVIPKIGEGPYHISFNVTGVSDGAGNSLAAAHNLGSRSHGADFLFSDYVGPDDTKDFYKFTIPNGSTVSTHFVGSVPGVQLFMAQDRNGDGIVQDSEKFFGTADLVPGTYFIGVQRTSTTGTKYQVHMTVDDVNDGAGNSRAAARDIGTVKGSSPAVSTAGYVGFDDTSDFYKFNVGVFSTIKITLDHLVADADLTLFDQNGNVIASSSHGGTTADSVSSFQLLGGTFFARVQRFGTANTTYRLTFST